MASKADRVLLRNLRHALHSAADPERAPQQQAYMKSTMPYLGIVAPVLHKITNDAYRQHPLSDASVWIASVMALWRRAEYREERYAALALLGHKTYSGWLTPDLLNELEEIIVTGAWWDYVDQIAVNQFGQLLRLHPGRLTPTLKQWSRGDNLWLRRTAILAQLKFKQHTDSTLLFELIEPSVTEKGFFLKKAIGWALREYSKTEPQIVIDYINANRERLQPLSIKEGMKVLVKQGGASGARTMFEIL